MEMKKSLQTTLKSSFAAILLSASIVSCDNDESKINTVENTPVNNSFTTANNSLLNRIRIKFMISIGANLERPSLGCDSGFGICEIRIGLASIGFDKVNFGVSDDNHIHLVMERESVEEEFITISEGDESITLDQDVVTFFKKEGFDIANIKLVRGQYAVKEEVGTGKYTVAIPFEKI